MCVCTYLIAELRLWYQSFRSSWLLDISRSLALGKVNWRERRGIRMIVCMCVVIHNGKNSTAHKYENSKIVVRGNVTQASFIILSI